MSQGVRSVSAVLIGFVVLTTLVSMWAALVPVVWPSFGPQPGGGFVFAPPGHVAFKIEMVVNVLVSVVAGYACAAVARRAPAMHVAVLGLVMLGFSAAYALGWAGAEFGAAKPMWAHVGTAVGLVAGLAIGVGLRQRHTKVVA